MSYGSFTALKHPGFCESLFYGTGAGPEYSNSASGALITVLVGWYAWRTPRQPETDIVLASLACNGVAACVFHYTLWELPGALDSFTMLQTIFTLLLCIYSVTVITGEWSGGVQVLWVMGISLLFSLTAVLSPWPRTGINFAWLIAGLAGLVILLLLYQTRLQPSPTLSRRLAWMIAEFLFGAACWLSTEPWCGTVPALRYLFWCHSIWHLTVTDAICRLVLLQQERVTLALNLPPKPSPQ